MEHYSRAQWAQIAEEVHGKRLSGRPEQTPWEESIFQNYELGSRMVLTGSTLRVLYYAHIHSGMPLLPRGRPAQSSDDGTERGAFLGAQVAGSRQVTWTAVGDIAADQFAGGFLLTQGGFMHTIVANTAAAALANSTLTLLEPFATCEAIAAGRYGLLVENPYANVVTRSEFANVPGSVVGVSNLDFITDYYVWLQTWGPCGVIGQPNLGDADAEQAMAHGTMAGSEVRVATAFGDQVIGHTLPYNSASWENENFMLLDLCIRR